MCPPRLYHHVPVLVLLLCTTLPVSASAAKMLIFSPVNSGSQMQFASRLAQLLAQSGNDVTLYAAIYNGAVKFDRYNMTGYNVLKVQATDPQKYAEWLEVGTGHICSNEVESWAWKHISRIGSWPLVNTPMTVRDGIWLQEVMELNFDADMSMTDPEYMKAMNEYTETMKLGCEGWWPQAHFAWGFLDAYKPDRK